MSRRVILVQHDHGPADDRVSTWLVRNGFDPVYRRPFAGDVLEAIADDVAGSVVFGGRFEAYETGKYPFLKDEARWIEACMAKGVPLLGICQGAQQIAHTLGARVGPQPDERCEFGCYEIRPTAAGTGIFPQAMHVTQRHFHTFDIPRGAERLAGSDLFANQAFRYGGTTVAFQFHAEVTREGFARAQDSVGAFFGRPGAQTREEQDALLAAHDARQAVWFDGFLDGFFNGSTAS